jgi:hypothetical protein
MKQKTRKRAGDRQGAEGRLPGKDHVVRVKKAWEIVAGGAAATAKCSAGRSFF